MTLKVTGIGNSKATVYLKFTLLWRTQPHAYTPQPVTQAGHILSQSFNIFLFPSPTLTQALSYFPQSTQSSPPPPPPPLSTLMCCVLSLSIPQQRMSFRGTLRIGSRPGITQRSQREMARPSPRCVLMHYSHPLILSSSLLMLPCLSVWASLRTWIYMHCLLSPDGCPTDHFVRLFVSSVPLYDESSECVLTGLLETLTWLRHSVTFITFTYTHSNNRANQIISCQITCVLILHSKYIQIVSASLPIEVALDSSILWCTTYNN